METIKLEHEREKREGLKFPNWTDCKYRDTCCLPCVREKREASLLMKRCSNNDSIKECWMYQYLEKNGK